MQARKKQAIPKSIPITIPRSKIIIPSIVDHLYEDHMPSISSAASTLLAVQPSIAGDNQDTYVHAYACVRACVYVCLLRNDR